MKNWHKIISLASILIFFGILFIQYQPKIPLHSPQISPAIMESISPQVLSAETTNSPGICHINGVLPDSSCTPGAIDPGVTQETIQQTICVKGYTTTVRPPVSYTNKLKAKQIAEYGFSDADLHNYEEDHLISLELGGSATDPKNLWPEPGNSPNQKDTVENRCHKMVCAGEITLLAAQQQIATDWTKACQ